MGSSAARCAAEEVAILSSCVGVCAIYGALLRASCGLCVCGLASSAGCCPFISTLGVCRGSVHVEIPRIPAVEAVPLSAPGTEGPAGSVFCIMHQNKNPLPPDSAHTQSNDDRGTAKQDRTAVLLAVFVQGLKPDRGGAFIPPLFFETNRLLCCCEHSAEVVSAATQS